MKLRYILVIGFILFLISIGTACASDNATDENVLSDGNGPRIEFDEYGLWDTWEDGDGEIARIYSSDNLSGEVIVNIDNVEHFKDDISKCKHYVDEDDPEFSHYYLTQKQLSPNLGKGQYNLTVTYNNQSKSGILIIGDMIEIEDNIFVGGDNWDYSTFCRIHDGDFIDGTVKITFNGTKCYYGEFPDQDDETNIYFTDLELPKGFKYGIYDVKVTYEKRNGKTYTTEKKVLYDYYFDLSMNFANTVVYYDKTIKTDVNFYITLHSAATGNVVIKFNGKKYTVDSKKYSNKAYKVKDVKLDVGEYTAHATYSSSKFHKRTVNCTQTLFPVAEWPASMSVGQDDYIYVVAPKNSKGTVTLYQGIYVDDDDGDQWLVPTKKIGTANLVDGYAAFSLKSLPEGYHHFYLNYTINGINGFENEIHIEVLKNTKGFSSSVSATKIKIAKSVTLTVKGPSGSGKVYVYLDNSLYKHPSLSSGKVKLTFSKLKVGTHRIDVFYQKSKKFYSATHYVTVKPPVIKLTLQKVKVKKSAKSLKIKVKLKVDGKKAKYKKVKLKFNKKTLKVKTNRKGIAKFTISKKVLKKLKVGSSVTYKASYGGKTVKRIVEVKR